MNSKLTEAKEAIDRQDYTNALSLLLPLAEAGEARAQSYLGFMYQLGLGVERHGGEAIKWLQKAVDQGEGSAAHNLGTIYLCGMPGVPPNRDVAKSWYRKARDLGFIVAENSWYE